MTWVKLDDNFPDNRKLLNISDAAKWLYVAGLCYCGRNHTDGHIPTGHALRLTDTATEAVAAELEAATLWEPADDGWMVPDFLEFNPSRAQVEAQRAAARERQSRRRSQGESRRDIPRESHDPVPSRPDPDNSSSSSTTQDSCPQGEEEDDRVSQVLEAVLQRRLSSTPNVKSPKSWLAVVARNMRDEELLDVEALRLLEQYPEITDGQLIDVLCGNRSILNFLTKESA